MTATRWRIGGVLAAILLLVVTWFVVISPGFQQASALETETVSQQDASQQLRSRISLLKKQSAELPAQEAKLASIQQRMPATAALPTLLRNLTDVAASAHVTVSAVTPGRPTAIAQPAPPAPPAPADTDSSDTDSTDADSSEADSSEDGSGDSQDAAGATGAVSGPTAQAMTLNITACGTFAELRSYLRELESMKRLTMVSTLSIARGSCAEGGAETDLTASISASVFTLPNATTGSTTTTEGSGDE